MAVSQELTQGFVQALPEQNRSLSAQLCAAGEQQRASTQAILGHAMGAFPEATGGNGARGPGAPSRL